MCFQMLSYEAIAIVASTWKNKEIPPQRPTHGPRETICTGEPVNVDNKAKHFVSQTQNDLLTTNLLLTKNENNKFSTNRSFLYS